MATIIYLEIGVVKCNIACQLSIMDIMRQSSAKKSAPMPVLYIDFKFTSAKEFWAELVVPAYERFKAEPIRANAIDVSVHAWHVHEWIWHDHHPGEDTQNNSDYKTFQDDRVKNCPELEWIRDVADAGKHRGLGRKSVNVQQVASKTRFVGAFNTATYNTLPYNGTYSVQTPLVITLTDGSVHGFAEVLSRVIDYWRVQYFQ